MLNLIKFSRAEVLIPSNTSPAPTPCGGWSGVSDTKCTINY